MITITKQIELKGGKMTSLFKMKGTCTTCNKKIDNVIIINTSSGTMYAYLDYTENNKGECIQCYLNRKTKIKETVATQDIAQDIVHDVPEKEELEKNQGDIHDKVA